MKIENKVCGSTQMYWMFYKCEGSQVIEICVDTDEGNNFKFPFVRLYINN